LIDIEKTRIKVQEILQKKLSPLLTYHSYDHTCGVVKSCIEIAAHEHIYHPSDLVLLETAAWFHDIGFINIYKEHEQHSVEIAKDLLPQLGANDNEIDLICEMIMATRLPQSPQNLLSSILCDADLDYLGSMEFPQISKGLKEEWISLGIINSEEEFYKRQLSFLHKHNYFTRFSRKNRGPVKRQHLRNLLLAERQKTIA
jgi:uncharacterized protein